MDFYDSWYNISMSRLLILAASDFWDIVTLSYGITDRQTDRPTDAAENPTLRLLHSHFNRGQCVTVDKLRSIVMSASVCVCVCLSVCLSTSIFPEPSARSLPNFYPCCLWPWLGPPLASWRNPQGKRQFWSFSSPLTMHCTAQHLGPIQKQLNRWRCRLGWWLWWFIGTIF